MSATSFEMYILKDGLKDEGMDRYVINPVQQNVKYRFYVVGRWCSLYLTSYFSVCLKSLH